MLVNIEGLTFLYVKFRAVEPESELKGSGSMIILGARSGADILEPFRLSEPYEEKSVLNKFLKKIYQFF